MSEPSLAEGRSRNLLPKLTYSDIISTLSIILSIISLLLSWKSDASNITIRALKPKIDLRCNRGAVKWEVMALLPFQINNNGKGMTSLIEIRQRKRPNPLLAKSSGQPRQFPASAVVLTPKSVNQTPQDAMALDLAEDFIDSENADRTFLNFETQPDELLAAIPPEAGTIKPGVPANFTLGFISDMTQQGARINRFTLHVELFFSNGALIPAKAVIETPSDKGRACPP